MSRPHLDFTTLGMNTTNGTTSPIDSIPVGTKTPEPTPLIQPTGLLDQNGKTHVPGDPDPDPSSSDSLSKKSNSLNDSNSSKLIKNKSNKMKNCRKHKKQDASDSFSRVSDSSDNSDYRHKRRKKKSHRKTDPIKLCARLMEELLTTEYKSKIIRFKMDWDLLQSRIYFLAFV